MAGRRGALDIQQFNASHVAAAERAHRRSRYRAAMVYRFAAHVYLHQGETGWHFLTLPGEVADEIDLLTEDTRRGFGSVKVRATIGSTTWETSIFPDTSSESFVLPVKKPVRTAEDIDDGDQVDVVLELVDRPPMLA